MNFDLRWGALFVGLSVAVLTVPVHAQEDAYRTVITNALAEFEAGNYDEALVLFREAHNLQPSARTLRGLGNVLFELRRYDEAIGYLDESLLSTVNPLTPDQREEVEALLGRAAAFVGHITITLEPADAAVLVDGQPFGPPWLVTVGEHEVRVTADGFEPFAAHVAVDGGETETLVVTLIPIGGSSLAPIETVTEPASDGLLVPSLAVMGVGVLALVGMGVLGGMAMAERDRVAAACGTERFCLPEQVRGMDDLALGADVLLGVGAAIVVVGGILLIIDPPHGERSVSRASVLPWASPEGAGVVVGGVL